MTKNSLKSVPKDRWPATQHDPRRIAVYVSSEFLVQVFTENEEIIRLSVCTTQVGKNGRWRDGISWDALQQIKNECGFSGSDAVEVYPAQQDVVNVANMRHLWVMPNKLSYVWR